MKKKIMVAGFGGQGVMSIGKNMVEAGMEQGLEVSWVPSYGPEMRGGTANCMVTIADEPIAAPVFSHFTDLIAMNGPSLDKFLPSVIPGGTVYVNRSAISQKVDRDDVTVIDVPCDTIATELGNLKASNMVMLGAYVAAGGMLKKENVVAMIHSMFTGRKAKLVDLNLKCLDAGMACVK